MDRPSSSVPFRAAIARSAASSSSKVTKPKPRERPESRSVITLASVISPKRLNACSSLASLVSQLRLPTNSFFAILSSRLPESRPFRGVLMPRS
jgi:hypothetical protein